MSIKIDPERMPLKTIVILIFCASSLIFIVSMRYYGTTIDFAKIQEETRRILDSRCYLVVNQLESSEDYWSLLAREEKLKTNLRDFIKKPKVSSENKKKAERILAFLNSDMSLKKANSDIFQEKFGKEIDSIP